ncbi:MAG: DNA-3-methyladenine glycosylase 2 family protein [Lachnospiraceae bacterium]|nr:DNA-3-methyladenine glycosylase 2 family protein [Lachnospiraceae bacterium]
MLTEIKDDFDLRKIEDSGQCFRVRRSEEGVFTFIHLDSILHIKKIRDCLYDVSCDEKKWKGVWESYFDLKRDYGKIRDEIPDDDRYMKEASLMGKGIRILKQDPWEMLITFIISQRRNIPSIKRSVELICDRYGTHTEGGDAGIKLFPKPAQMKDLSIEDLAGLNLGYRDEYILDACKRVNSGETDLNALYDASDEELVNELKKIKGVGNKVAGCIGLFAYERTGLVPVDTWIGRVIEDVYGGEDPFVRYGENAGIMQQWAFYRIRSEKADRS